ncbi:hypothetical protein LSAT2_023153, partial [Lamellibrachia satsuma]
KASENKAMLFWWTSTNANTVASEATFSNGYICIHGRKTVIRSSPSHLRCSPWKRGWTPLVLYINDVPQKVASVSHHFVYRKIKMKQDSQIVQPQKNCKSWRRIGRCPSIQAIVGSLAEAKSYCSYLRHHSRNLAGSCENSKVPRSGSQ